MCSQSLVFVTPGALTFPVQIPERVRVRVSVLIYVKSFVNFAMTVTV
jgi:hypothetical protein